MGETGCGKSTTARLLVRLLDPTSGTIRVRRPGHRERQEGRAEGAPPPGADDLPGSLLVAQPAQDGRLDHRRPVRHPRAAQGVRRAPQAGPGADGPRRAEPRALQPLPARVLGRPAPADRRGARDRARAEAAGRRRAGVGARRLDPGPGAEPAAQPPARDGPDADLHRPRPVGRAPHVRPRRGHVPGQDRRDRPERRPVQLPPPPLHRRAALGRARPRARAAAGASASC